MTVLGRLTRLRWWVALWTLALGFITLVAVMGRVLYVGLSARLAATPSRPPRSIPNTDVNPYGANFFLAREVEPWKLDKTLHMAADAGIGWVKQQFSWEEIEPRRKGEFLEPTTKADSWAKYDIIVAACEKHGLQIVARLDRPPDWAREDNTYKERPPDDYEDYGDFVYEFVKRYEGRVNYVQIWNEPNVFPEWGNQAVDPIQYVELLKIAHRRAKEANPNVYVLNAPLAITFGQPHPEPGKWISMNDLDFLEEMYRAGARAYFDIYSANAFGMDRPPEDPPGPDQLNFQRVLLQRKIMERHGDGKKAVWFNEYGWNASPESMPQDRLLWRRVSEKLQAEYTLRGIEMARRDWPWAGAFMIWYFRQVGNIPPDRSDYYFRVVDADFTPRLLYFSVQDVARRQNVAGPGLCEETSPGVRTYGRWQNAIETSASGRAYITSNSEGDSITFTYRGSGIDLMTRRWRGSGRLLVSLDGHSVSGLPMNSQGLSYVDLFSPVLMTQARIPLVRHSVPGEHTLRVTVAGDRNPEATGGECIVDAFRVVQEENPDFPVLPLAACILGLACDGWLLWWTWRHVRWAVRPPQ